MEIKQYIWDIETIKGCFLAFFYDIQEKRWIKSYIHHKRNDLYALVKFFEDNQNAQFIGFNSLAFDAQVIKFIIQEHQKWFDKSNCQISAIIQDFATELIDDMKYGIFPPYRDDALPGVQIDIFRVQHFDNKNRRVGLKRLEFEMDAENIEEMGVSPFKEDFTDEEIDQLDMYCCNDIWETYRNYRHVIGDVEHPIYKGTNQIEIRDALKEKFGFNCLNWSDSKYGDEIIKTIYCKQAGIAYDKLPKKGTFRKYVKFANGIPEYIEFQTPQLKSFLLEMKDKEIGAEEEFEEIIQFRNQTYVFGVGGLHNKIENKRYESDDQYVLIDADVTSFYPIITINNKYAPAHLKKEAFCTAYEWIYNERVSLKPQSKKDKKVKGVVAGLKAAAVSVYGKSGDMSNWLYDPQMRLNICITGELSLMMLIEAQELAENRCIMANTDGATFLVRRSDIDRFMQICNEWMEKTKYQLEFFTFKTMNFLSVNGYIAEWEDYWDDGKWKPYIDPVFGKVKRKKEFLTFTELHKNKSFRIIPLALYAYFIDGIAVEDYINQFDDIFQFCGRTSAGDNYTHKGWTVEGEQIDELPKLIRYYVSKRGIKIKKIVKENVDTGANDTNVTPADKLKGVCNRLPKEDHHFHLQNVDRQWYIDSTNEIIFRLERGKKPKRGIINPNQQSLF